MKIKDKSPELLQAQLAAFTDSEVEQAEYRTFVHSQLARFANQNIQLITDSRYEAFDATNPLKARPLIHHEIAGRKQYTAYLRAIGGAAANQVAVRHELLTAYSRYSQGVDRLRRSIPPLAPSRHEAFLGSGDFSHAYRMQYGEHLLVVRIPHNRENTEVIDAHVAGMIKARGMPDMEQLVGISYRDNVTISEFIEGTPFGALTLEERASVSPHHIQRLHETVARAHTAGIVIDTLNPDNFLYNPKTGFGVIDYSDRPIQGVPDMNLEETYAALHFCLFKQ